MDETANANFRSKLAFHVIWYCLYLAVFLLPLATLFLLSPVFLFNPLTLFLAIVVRQRTVTLNACYEKVINDFNLITL